VDRRTDKPTYSLQYYAPFMDTNIKHRTVSPATDDEMKYTMMKSCLRQVAEVVVAIICD